MNEEQIQNTQQNLNWLDEEQKKIEESSFEGEQLPALKLEEGKITEFDIDFAKAFEQWIDPDSGVVKKIIPVMHNGEKKNFWLSTRNPTYKKIVEKGRKGQVNFKILCTGQQKNTRYTIID